MHTHMDCAVDTTTDPVIDDTFSNKAIVDHTLLALLAHITSFPAYHICSKLGSDGMIPSAA